MSIAQVMEIQVFNFGVNDPGPTLLTTVDSIAYSDGWIEICMNYVATTTGIISLDIKMLGKNGTNDGAIDDISFKPLDCDCCDKFNFKVERGCTGKGIIQFLGDWNDCEAASISTYGFDNTSYFQNKIEGYYNLCYGESRKVGAYLIGINGDTLCHKSATFHCHAPNFCTDIITKDYIDYQLPNVASFSTWRNPCLTPQIYAIRINGVITADGYGTALPIPPYGQPGFPSGSININGTSMATVEYLDMNYLPICSKSMVVDALPPSGAPFAKTSIEEQALIALENSINLAPNPTSDQVTVTFNLLEDSEVSIQLTSISGQQIVYNQTLHLSEGQQVQQISVDEFPKGMYIVTINANGILVNKQLVIQ